MIRTKFSDRLQDLPGEPAEPAPAQGFDVYFTSAGAGSHGIYDYLNDQMPTIGYEAEITPWYTLDLTEADALALRIRTRDRFAIVATCAELAGRDVDLARFKRLVVILNAPSRSDGSRGGDFTGGFPYLLTVDGVEREYGVSVFGSSLFDVNSVLQELLHAYPVAGRTMPHGRHAFRPGMASEAEYGDPYDVMSAANNFYVSRTWGAQGAALSGARRELAGWVDERRKVEYVPDESLRYPDRSVELIPVGAREPGLTLIKIPVGDDSRHYYTVEHRSRTGWDEALPADGVLIYEVRTDNIAYLMTRWPGNRAEWDAQRGAGESWTAPLSWGLAVTVSIDRADATGATVRLSVR